MSLGVQGLREFGVSGFRVGGVRVLLCLVLGFRFRV